MAAVRALHGQDNGCNSEGCNVLTIVGVQIDALADLQASNTLSIQALINEKFDNIEKNNVKESNRIDELRKGDIEAVKIANDSTVKRAELLSTQLMETAETVRKNTDTLASTLATQLQLTTARQDEKIAALEKVNWETTGKGQGSQLTRNSLIGILAIAIAVITVIMGLINFFRA